MFQICDLVKQKRNQLWKIYKEVIPDRELQWKHASKQNLIKALINHTEFTTRNYKKHEIWKAYKLVSPDILLSWRDTKEKMLSHLLLAYNSLRHLEGGVQEPVIYDLPPGNMNIFEYTYTTPDELQEALSRYEQEAGNNLAFLRVGIENYRLNRETIQKLVHKLREGYVAIMANQFDSDAEAAYDILMNLRRPLLLFQLPRQRNERPSGAFFPYVTKFNLHLERYGIYTKFKKELKNCLIYAVEKAGDKYKNVAERLKFQINNLRVPLSSLNRIAKENNLHITVHYINNKKRKLFYNPTTHNKDTLSIEIGLIANHYFIYEQVPFTEYSIKNHKKVCKIKNWNQIIKVKNRDYDTKIERNKKKYTNSFRLIQLLLEQKDYWLQPLSYNDIIHTVHHSNADISTSPLETSDDLHDIYTSVLTSKHFENPQTHWFDIEACPDNKKRFIPYVCSFVNKKNHTRSFYTEEQDCVLRYLNYLNKVGKNTTIYIHNAGFDCRFLLRYLTSVRTLEKGTKIMVLHARYKRINIKVVDTYSIIPRPLSMFSRMFDIAVRKEIINHDKITYDLKEKKFFMPIEEYESDFNEEEKKQFRNNVKEWHCELNGKLDIYLYASKYCEMDCIVLKQGYEKFKKMVQDACDLNLDWFVSLPQLAYTYLIKEKCFEECYQVKGIVRAFIQKCCVGGRVMTRRNKKYHIKKKLADFDAVSLYPSAISRMGFLKGKAKVLQTTEFDRIKNYDGYFLEIELVSIGKRYPFPAISYVDGNRKWTDDIEELRGKTLYVDKNTLEDWITYHDIDFIIKRGYYYDEGRNYTCQSVIRKLFEKRLEYKSQKNPIQLIYKLIMNSCYGRMIMKEITNEKVYVLKKDFNKYVSYHYSFIDYWVELENHYLIKKKIPISSHKSSPHIGGEILSMSKRIMNEVVFLAHDIRSNIHYTDTDSVHIDLDSIEKLSSHFYKRHGRELIGKNMGQFHCDFDFKSDEEPYAVESYFLGKKSYIDRVRCIINNEEIFHYHIRMKGIPTKSILHKCKDISPMDLYKKLYKGRGVTFDLAKGHKLMDFRRDMSIYKNDEFLRKVKF